MGAYDVVKTFRSPQFSSHHTHALVPTRELHGKAIERGSERVGGWILYVHAIYVHGIDPARKISMSEWIWMDG